MPKPGSDGGPIDPASSAGPADPPGAGIGDTISAEIGDPFAWDGDRMPVAGTDDPSITTFGRLLEVVRRLNGIFACTIAARTGLPIAHFEALLRLGRSSDDRLTMSELAHQLGMTSGGATRLVDRLSRDDLVERLSCPTDRRVHYVRLTEQGRDQLAEAVAWHREDLARELTSRLSATELATLDATLDRLRTDIEVDPGRPGNAFRPLLDGPGLGTPGFDGPPTPADPTTRA